MFADLKFDDLLTSNPKNLLKEFLSSNDESSNDFTIRQWDLVKERALQYENSASPIISYSEFTDYWESGVRSSDHKYYELRGRLLVFSLMAYKEMDEPKWLNYLCDVIWQICSEPFWCIPAHFYDEQRKPLPFSLYETHLDLFSAETAFALSETLVLHENRLPEMIKEQIRKQIWKRVFDVWLDPERKFYFESLHNNWPAVCAASIGGSALHLLSDSDELHRILERCMKCFDTYLTSFNADGICEEGAGYFSYGFGFFTCFSQLLEKRSEGRIDLLRMDEKIKNIVEAQRWYYISGDHPVTFSDCRELVKARMGISQYLAYKFDVEAPPVAEDLLDDECYRYCLAIRDILWTKKIKTIQDENLSKVFIDSQWFMSKSGTLALAAKGGINGVGHGHVDCGSFIVFSKGKACICDPGAGAYTAEYFSPKRFEHLVTRGSGHNIPIINGYEMFPGKLSKAEIVLVDEMKPIRKISFELKKCYPNEAGINSFIRTIEHDTKKHEIIITDEIYLEQEGYAYENFCAREPINIIEGKAIFLRDESRVEMKYDSTQFEVGVINQDFIDIDYQKKDVWFLRMFKRSQLGKIVNILSIKEA